MAERRKFSLRFNNAETERYFVASQTEELLKNLFRLCMLAAATASAMLGILIPAVRPLHGVTHLKVMILGADILTAVLMLSAGMLIKCRRLIVCVSPRLRELMAVFLMTYLLVIIFVLDLYYCPKMMGYRPEDLFDVDADFSDTRPVLALAVVMTGGHVTLPVRWIVLLPLELFSCCLYFLFAFIVGGPDGVHAWSTMWLYAVLVVCAALGRRAIEHHQREALSQLIMERSLRAETEHKLTMMEPGGMKRLPEDQLTSRDSRPETTDSAMEFTKAAEEGNMDGVIEIGYHEQWLIERKDLDLTGAHVLGKGGFGVVLGGLYAGAPAAIKRRAVNSAGVGTSHDPTRSLLSLLNEVRIMRRLHHPCIATFFGACIDSDEGDVTLVLEWVHGLCLEQFILRGGAPDHPVQVVDQFIAIYGTCQAVSHLHSRQPSIVHGDLKGTNIIMERNPSRPDSFRAKLLDFGLSRVLTRHAPSLGGTALWVAPEVVQNPHAPAHAEADVFSFGRLAFFVLTGYFPFGRRSRKQIRQMLRTGNLPPLPWPNVRNRLISQWRPWIEECSLCMPEARPLLGDVILQISRSLDQEECTDAEEIRGLPMLASDSLRHSPTTSGSTFPSAPRRPHSEEDAGQLGDFRSAPALQRL